MSDISILFNNLFKFISVLEVELNLPLHVFKVSSEALKSSISPERCFAILGFFFIKYIFHVTCFLTGDFLNFAILVSNYR